MPTEKSHRLYDLSPLKPLLQSGHLLLTPNYRLARRIKSEWDREQLEQNIQVWQPAPVHALEPWLQQCWQQAVAAGQLTPRVLLTAVQTKELWVRVIDRDRHDNGNYILMQTSSAAELAQQARDNLLRWCVDVSSTPVQSEFQLDLDCATFLRWKSAFEKELLKENFATLADALTDLRCADTDAHGIAVALVDFDDLPPLHQACLDKLASSLTPVSSATGTTDITARSYPDREAELAAVASWAAQYWRTDPTATLGILLVDMQADRAALEFQMRQEFDCMGENYASLPVNFSTGISLDQAPVVRDALCLLSSIGDTLPLGQVVALLRSRFTSQCDQFEDGAVKLLQQLFDDGAAEVEIGRLRHAAQQVSVGESRGLATGDVLREVANLRLRHQRMLPSAWVEFLCQALELWGWPGPGPLDSLEYQQVESWYRVLEEFAAFDSICHEQDLNSALGLLRRCCQAQISQPQTADSNIQVLGPLEGAGLHFDAIWLCGLQGNRWPAPARPNPFLPIAIQRQRQMPHASSEREWQYAHHLLQHYRGSCQTLIASYSRQLDGVPELPSPVLAELDIDNLYPEPAFPQAWLQQIENAQLQAVEDTQAPATSASELETLSGGSGILQDQAACPFRSFARNRLSVQALGDYRTGLSAADRGTILHNALYILWGELEDSATLQAMDTPTVNTAITRAVQTAIDETPQGLRQLVGTACLELEQQRLYNLLNEWLHVERSRGSFTVVGREEPVNIELGELSLKLRVDRVDQLPDGERVVIDYKSGRTSLSDWLGERPSQPQLPLYGLATEVAAVAFAQVRTRDCKMQGIGEVGDIPGVQEDIEKAVKRNSGAQDWGELQREWAENLRRLADAFVAGDAVVDPLSNACNFCGLETLCRVQLTVEVQI